MATPLYLRPVSEVSQATSFNHGELYQRLDGDSTYAMYLAPLLVLRGSGAIYNESITAAGPTSGLEVGYNSSPYFWITPPLNVDVTISGTITFAFNCAESHMSANASMNCMVYRVNHLTGALTQIAKTARTTEMTVTTETHESFTVTPTSTNFLRGDRILIIPFADDSSASMNSGYAWTFWYAGSSGGSGDSSVTFTETLTFESYPTGTIVYPTGTSAGINPGSATELEAWTSRGGGVTTAVTNTAAGMVSPIQITATGGGAVLEWYTKQLQAATFAGPVLFNLRGIVSATNTKGGFRVEVAITDQNGANATVWGVGGHTGQLTTSETDYQFWIGGASTSITDGQRIRLRIYLDDAAFVGGSAINGMVSGQTATLYYAGTSGGASGDTYVQFPFTLTEYVPTNSPNAGLASGSGAAHNTGASVQASMGVASGTGTALNAGSSVQARAGLASGSGVANGVTGSIGPGPATAAGTGAAYDADPTTESIIQVFPDTATGTGTALNAGGGVAASADLAAGSGAALDATVDVLVPGGEVDNLTPVHNPEVYGEPVYSDLLEDTEVYGEVPLSTIFIEVEPGVANAGVASGSGSALSPSLAVEARAGVATGTGAAHDPTIAGAPGGNVFVYAGIARGTGRAYQASGQGFEGFQSSQIQTKGPSYRGGTMAIHVQPGSFVVTPSRPTPDVPTYQSRTVRVTK